MKVDTGAGDEDRIQVILKKTFGFDSFRPNQKEIILTSLSGRDVIAVMPTGGGKSLCYQLPSLMGSGTVVVVSPLISLMKDQVDAARENGIRASFLNSTLTHGEAASTIASLLGGKLDLLYIAPERLAVPGFLDTMKDVRWGMFAVDEAHCISQWGHDFRPEYRNLAVLRQSFPDVPIAAFTASATMRVQDDIVRCLGLVSPFRVRASFDRPNLFYEVKRKDQAERQVSAFIRERAGQPGIVYCGTRKTVDTLTEFLRSSGVNAVPYHAGLPAEERKRNQDLFNKDLATVMVATVAFGMGIDKPNIRYVIHVSLPADMESYYQETGRAGRDGDPSYCLLLSGSRDIPVLRNRVTEIEDETLRAYASKRLEEMIRYAGSNVCRRKAILRYFGEEYEKENCSTCDVCLGERSTVDITEDAQKFMAGIYRSGQRFGAGQIVDIVTGSDTEKIRRYGHERLKTYGAGSDSPKPYWRAVSDELISQGCIRQNGDRYTVLSLTDEGLAVLYGRKRLYASSEILDRKKGVERASASKKAEREAVIPNKELFELLKAWRSKTASEWNVPPYVVASDRTLRDISGTMPRTERELLAVHGIGEKRLADLGPAILRVVRSYLEDTAGEDDNPFA